MIQKQKESDQYIRMRANIQICVPKPIKKKRKEKNEKNFKRKLKKKKEKKKKRRKQEENKKKTKQDLKEPSKGRPVDRTCT